MTILYLTEPGMQVCKNSQHLILRKEGTIVRTIPAHQIEKVVIFGQVQLTTQAMDFLLQENIDTVFLSASGRYRGRLVGPMPKNIPLRLSQYQKVLDERFPVQCSKEFTYGKIRNSIAVLRRFHWRNDKIDLADPLREMALFAEKARIQTDLESLRGMEGNAARLSFDCMRQLIKNDFFSFPSRSRRPPLDPANAVLSFFYTMLFHLVESHIYQMHLDPFLGCFHAVQYGKPALALDLMEEFRPLVDRLFLSIANKKMMNVGDFQFRDFEGEPDEHGVYLNVDGRRKAVALFHEESNREFFYSRHSRLLPLNSIFKNRLNCSGWLWRKKKTTSHFVEGVTGGRYKKYYIVSYDISNDKKRTKMLRLLKNYGVRVQKSVFECLISERLF